MKNQRILSILALLCMLLSLCSCSTKKADNVETTATQAVTQATEAQNSDLMADAKYKEDTELGEGKTTFTFYVDVDGNKVNFKINTDKKTVGEALLENNLIKGTDSDYGLYVKEVNGISADYDTDGYYWAFYVNDEYAQTGVDSTDIEDGMTCSFVRTKG